MSPDPICCQTVVSGDGADVITVLFGLNRAVQLSGVSSLSRLEAGYVDG
ncbi:MAG: hypothetical protein ACI9MC_002632, partial [Kiritimatiellia bacterium]